MRRLFPVLLVLAVLLVAGCTFPRDTSGDRGDFKLLAKGSGETYDCWPDCPKIDVHVYSYRNMSGGQANDYGVTILGYNFLDGNDSRQVHDYMHGILEDYNLSGTFGEEILDSNRSALTLGAVQVMEVRGLGDTHRYYTLVWVSGRELITVEATSYIYPGDDLIDEAEAQELAGYYFEEKPPTPGLLPSD
jgi:hypothetical protein